MINHYNCTIESFLLHSFLLVYHPYPPSFHEMIFELVYIITSVDVMIYSAVVVNDMYPRPYIVLDPKGVI